MKIGCWLDANAAPAAARMGFEYVELRTSELFPEKSERTFASTVEAIRRAGIPALTFNYFIPATLPVVGPAVDWPRFRKYVTVAAERAARLGGHTFVFGSGGARSVPDGFSRLEAAKQYREAVLVAADAASRCGMQIAIEPLNRTETNFLHTLEEAIEHAAALDQPNIGVLADCYHMHMEAEPFRNVMLAGARLFHVQVCDTGRMPPGFGVLDLAGFFTYLNATRYDGTVSVEATFGSFGDEGPRALAYLRRVVASTGTLGFSA